LRTITLTYGLPASGKSTWSKEQVKNSEDNIVRVNMDDIRAMLALPYSKDAEAVALKIQDQAILSAIKAGKDVIVDNTHIEKNMPKRIKQLFDGDVLFKVQDFTHVSKEDCIERDKSPRRNVLGQPSRTVGSEVIGRMHNRMTNSKWKLTEEWMNDYMFPLEPYVPNSDSSLCVVFDLDGTLFRHHRSPYDYSKVGTDTVYENVKQLLKFYWDNHYSVFLCSGRPDVQNGLDIRKMTEDSLAKNSIPYDHLFMRDGVMQKDWNDSDVKHYIFNTEFRDNYEIENWFDDRDRVVRRLRKLGVSVNQVRDGDF
jgi:predicted kinase